jgi:hypothetical protein
MLVHSAVSQIVMLDLCGFMERGPPGCQRPETYLLIRCRAVKRQAWEAHHVASKGEGD